MQSIIPVPSFAAALLYRPPPEITAVYDISG